MGTTRRKFSSAFKARVALEALKERETLSELSTRFEVAQEIISRWKGEFVKQSSIVFETKQRSSDAPSVEVLAYYKAWLCLSTSSSKWY